MFNRVIRPLLLAIIIITVAQGSVRAEQGLETFPIDVAYFAQICFFMNRDDYTKCASVLPPWDMKSDTKVHIPPEHRSHKAKGDKK